IVVGDITKPLPPETEYVEVLLKTGEKVVIPVVNGYAIVPPQPPGISRNINVERPNTTTTINIDKLIQEIPEKPSITVVQQTSKEEQPITPKEKEEEEQKEAGKTKEKEEEEQKEAGKTKEKEEPKETPTSEVVTVTPRMPPTTGPGMTLPTIPGKYVATAQMLTIGGGKLVKEIIRV
ncbi:MAG: hypothetical protein QXT64_01890, partial [Desulfurococcaceae archaeon]